MSTSLLLETAFVGSFTATGFGIVGQCLPSAESVRT